MFSRCLILFKMRPGSSCQQAYYLISWIDLREVKQVGAIPKVSIQSQQQQKKQFKKVRLSEPTLLPSSSVIIDSATQSSYLYQLQEPRKKAIAVKSRLKSPPTQDSTVSILPIVLVMVRSLVDLQILNLTYLVVERETALETNFQIQEPVQVQQELTGRRLVSVTSSYSAILIQPTVPIVLENAIKIFFSKTLTTASSFVGVIIVSSTKNLTLKQSLAFRQFVMQVLMLEVLSQEASFVWLHCDIYRLKKLQLLEPAYPDKAILDP